MFPPSDVAVLPASGARRADRSPENAGSSVNLHVVFNGTPSPGLVEPASAPHGEGGGVFFLHRSPLKMLPGFVARRTIVYRLV